jgi:hypothetical protein
LFDAQIALPAVRLGNRDAVAVAQGEGTWTIDNGRTRFAVAPNFSGSLSSWKEGGTNHLLSPYPEQKTFGWMSPWYGGLTPLARHGHEMPGKLGEETFASEAVDATDGRGIAWRGVRVSCEMVREQLVGLATDLDFLTVGGSNVLKLVYRARNLTTARRRLGYGWLAFWQLDGAWEHNTLVPNPRICYRYWRVGLG